MSLKRRLNLADATLLIVGNVIGAGIFTTSGFLASQLPHPWLFLGIWVLGGLLTLCGALTYAELASMYPLAGGDYQYLKAAYGPGAGFLLGWLAFWVINPGSIAAMSIALASYLQGGMPAVGVIPGKPLAIGFILIFSWINYRGIRPGGTTQNIFTFGTLLLLVAMIATGLLSGHGDWGHLVYPGAMPEISWNGLLGGPMIAVIFTFSGWFASAYIGSEIREPQRNLPRSLILGTLCVTVLYLAINLVYLYARPLAALAGAENVGQLAMQGLYGVRAARWISLPIMLAIAAGINATVMTGARVAYAMGENGGIWQKLGRIHTGYRTPSAAIFCQAALAVLMVLFGTFGQLLSCVVFVMILTSIASGVALLVLRRRHPGQARSYKTPCYPLVPLLFVGSYLLVLVQVGRDQPWPSLLGVLMLLAGLPFYAWSRRTITEDKQEGGSATEKRQAVE
ncbi:amino acid antiporter, putative [Syntrophotalea carbinolica DSM 2380]|uniref:Amino acid antiporter, putative n=1 Tax=Syntrophotalea carbinolica (strain DSM 2380 / NBRC 103641 / GraBd1) TaxID=338963 RepID=Q3A841_SYNC1|nr:amino acid permease [Syntrophotalea carbinolica]ABA87451.1 amino acid antiporter, putative [Syntrophotalea carbinolica DSM 2380]